MSYPYCNHVKDKCIRHLPYSCITCTLNTTTQNTKFNYDKTDNNTDTTSTISDYGQEEMYQ